MIAVAPAGPGGRERHVMVAVVGKDGESPLLGGKESDGIRGRFGADFEPMMCGKTLGDQRLHKVAPDAFIDQERGHYSGASFVEDPWPGSLAWAVSQAKYSSTVRRGGTSSSALG